MAHAAAARVGTGSGRRHGRRGRCAGSRSRCHDRRIPRRPAGTADRQAAAVPGPARTAGPARTRPERAPDPRGDRARPAIALPARTPAPDLRAAPRTYPTRHHPRRQPGLTRQNPRRNPMRIRIHTIALAICASLASAPLFAGTPISEPRPLDARGRIDIENVKGRIEVRAWDRNEVRITGTLGEGVEKLVIDGDRQDLEVRVEY